MTMSTWKNAIIFLSNKLLLYNIIMIYSYFSHPNSVCMSYYTHFCFSMNLSRKLFIGSIQAFIHAIFPNVFITSSSDLLKDMQDDFDSVGCDKIDETSEFPDCLHPTDLYRSIDNDN